jgi:glycerophosphoryl diester phosphodiesterase
MMVAPEGRAASTDQMRIPLALCLLTLGSLPVGAQAPPLIAHRGASHDAPENTLAAFELAWEVGANGIEGDFYLTADGHIVCIHDGNCERTAGVKLDVASSTLAELKELDVGSWKAPRYAGEAIPTLPEVLAAVPCGTTFLIEIKCGPEIVPALERDLAEGTVPLENIAVIAFDPEVIRACKTRLPMVRAYWLTGFRRDEKSGEIHPTVDEVLETLVRIGADALDCNDYAPMVNEEFVGVLRLSGFDFHAWTVDEATAARRLRSLGVSSITTNRPDHLRRELAGDIDDILDEFDDERVRLGELPDTDKYQAHLWPIIAAAPDDPSARKALVWMLRYGATDEKDLDCRALLLEHHLDSVEIGEVCAAFSGEVSTEAEGFLRAIREQVTSPSAKGLASYALSGLLRSRLELRTDLENVDGELLAEMETWYGAKVLREIRQLDVQATREMCEALLVEVQDLDLEIPYGNSTLKKRATGSLFELRRLQIGMTAPDISGLDLEGVELELAAFRGQVVLLDFWGDW